MNVRRSRAAVSDSSTSGTTLSALTTAQALLTRTVTLPPGVYVAIGTCWAQAFSSAGDPGKIYLRVDGAKIGSEVDIRTNAGYTHPLFGHFVHGGGSVTVDIWFVPSTGNSTFGISNETRFGRSLQLVRVGD